MDCLICSKVHFDGHPPIDQIISKTFCQLLDIQSTTLTWIFNSTTICPACSAKLGQIHGLYNQLEVIKVRLYDYRKEIIEDLVKSQETTEASGNELEERTKIIQELGPKVYQQRPNYDCSLTKIKTQDLVEENSIQNIFEADFFNNDFDDPFDDGPDSIPADMTIGQPLITTKIAQIILERIQLPQKSMDIDGMTKNSFDITHEPIASFIERDLLKFNLKKPSKSKTRTRNIKKSNHAQKRHGRPPKINSLHDDEILNKRKQILKQYPNYNSRDKKNSKKFLCSDCGSGFPRVSVLIDHQRIHTGELPFKCTLCTKAFNSKRNLDNHKIFHGIGPSSVQCTVCGKYMRKSVLLHHMERHEGIRNYLCDICSMAFTCELNLQRHRIDMHMNHNKINCPNCDQVFSRKTNLKEHILKYHEKKFDYTCPECNKAFVNNSRMQVHRRSTHLKKKEEILEKNYLCDFCEKSFRKKDSLKDHIRINHTMDTPFKCTVEGCKSRGFVNNAKLQRHLKIHSGIQENICPYCAKGYAVKSSLDTHIKHYCKDKPENSKIEVSLFIV